MNKFVFSLMLGCSVLSFHNTYAGVGGPDSTVVSAFPQTHPVTKTTTISALLDNHREVKKRLGADFDKRKKAAAAKNGAGQNKLHPMEKRHLVFIDLDGVIVTDGDGRNADLLSNHVSQRINQIQREGGVCIGLTARNPKGKIWTH